VSTSPLPHTIVSASSQGPEERAAVGGVVPLHLHMIAFVDFRGFGLLPPFAQRLGVSPHFDHIDPFGIDGIGGDGHVHASVECASTGDEIA
jgi:hypothetical protein